MSMLAARKKCATRLTGIVNYVLAITLVGIAVIASDSVWSATLNITGTSVKESAGRAEVVINLSAPVTSSTRVSFATVKRTAENGSDYFGDYRIIEFKPGETQKRVAISILNDTQVETDEEFSVRIFKADNGHTIGRHTDSVRILDDDGDEPDTISPDNDVSLPGLPSVDPTLWDESAVRRILHNFAYGGYASENQIRAWSEMAPWIAIKQILNVNEHNLRVAPHTRHDKDNLAQVRGTLEHLAKLWSSNNASNGTPAIWRERYGMQAWALENVWIKAALARGLNPVRQKIGLWETNYHMAVNRDAGLYGPQIVDYYDTIMTAHNNDAAYHQVMAKAAASSAIAEQYKHKDNYWIDNHCNCNEDFGREFHQLFFGILGTADRHKHETVTIKNTAKILTHMELPWIDGLQSFDPVVRFGSRHHHRDSIRILDKEISASSTARPKIEQLAAYAIQHPESLANLPVKIVTDLMDDRLAEWKKTAIRHAWASMPKKTLVRFLQAYAISTLYHDSNRVKYWTSVDRHTILTSRMALNNVTIHYEVYDPMWNGILVETTPMFSPIHNVFGGQTALEAARSSYVFQNNFNRLTADYWRYFNPSQDWGGMNWRKDWTQILPKSADGSYRIRDIAPWLWNYLIADGLKNFGPLERANIYAQLAGSESLQVLIDENNPERVIYSHEINNNQTIRKLVADLGERKLLLTSTTSWQKEEANGRVGSAVNFIAATPYMFAQEGR